MRRWQFSFGSVAVEITSADCASLLNALAATDICLQDVKYQDDLTLHTVINLRDWKKVKEIAQKHGTTVKILGISGIYPVAASIIKRPVLLAFLLITFFVSCYVPSRVLFISVEGNSNIPTRYILEAAAECGIRFGAERRQVRSEMMKNRLLEKIPQLQWAGINTSGCTAIISVKEKNTQDKESAIRNQVSSIVASRDGIIQSFTVFRGNPLCSVGQAVKAGQTLVSGYLDYGLITKTTQANAEIKALTFREMEIIAPSATMQRGECIRTSTRYSLRIGKKLIKFFKDSGNLNVTCGKIYLEEYIRLPGNFRLPIAVIKETFLFYGESYDETAGSDTEDWMTRFAQDHLKKSMISGEIISNDSEIIYIEDACHLYGKFVCMEMIGQVKFEQTILKDD